MYRFVTAMDECPASFLMAIAGAPRMARCEQNECRRTCQPVTRSPALFSCRLMPALMVVFVQRGQPLGRRNSIMAIRLPNDTGVHRRAQPRPLQHEVRRRPDIGPP